MRNVMTVFIFPFALAGVLAACAQPAAEAGSVPSPVTTPSGTPMQDKDVAGLPFANGQTFRTLDAYLDYRRELGKSDRATWYDEVSPGVYRFVARVVPPEQRRDYTRAELLAEFGFSE